MTLQEALASVGAGWAPLITRYFEMVALLPNASVSSCGLRSGMLDIHGTSSDPLVQDMLDRLTWTFERTSVKICEMCGEKGLRRKMLPGCPNRCMPHYLEALQQAVDNGWVGE